MRRLFSGMLAVALAIMLASCTQYVFIPLPGSDSDKGQVTEVNEPSALKEFAREFSMVQALQDAVNGEAGISFVETDTTGSTDTDALVTKCLSFSGYKQGDYVIEDGKAEFSFRELNDLDTVCSIDAEGLVVSKNKVQIIKDFAIDIDDAKTAHIHIEEADGDYSISFPFPTSAAIEIPSGAIYSVDNTEFIYAETEEGFELNDEVENPLIVIGSINLRQLIDEFVGKAVIESEGIRQTSLVYELNSTNRNVKFSIIFSLDSFKLGNVYVTGDILMECDIDVSKAYTLSTPSYVLVREEGETAASRLVINEISGDISCNTSVIEGALKFDSNGLEIGAVNTISCTLNGNEYSKDDIYGTGTPENPYKIYTADMLRSHFVNEEETAAGKHATIMASIDFDGYEWSPTEKYEASLDGNENTISNLVIKGTDTSLTEVLGPQGKIENLTLGDVTFLHTASTKGIGLVGELQGTVQNVHILDSCKIEIKNDTPNYIGAIAAEMSSGLIAGCTNAMDISEGEYVGGIVGDLDGGGEIRECTNTGDLIVKDVQIGGIVGQVWASDEILIQGCVNKGAVSTTEGTSSIGGIIGTIDGESDINTAILKCINYGDVINSTADSSTVNPAGGITGQNGGANIEGCINYGKISASHAAGGIAGKMYGNGIIKASWNDGDITSEAGSVDPDSSSSVGTGGIAGYVDESSIVGSYNTGSVTTGYSNAGGILGTARRSTTVIASYNIGNTGSAEYAGGIAGGYDETRTNEPSSVSVCYSVGTVSADNAYGIMANPYEGSAFTGCVTTSDKALPDGFTGAENVSSINWDEAMSAMNSELDEYGISYVRGSGDAPLEIVF